MTHPRTNGVLQGPESIAAAQALREQRASKSSWPYPWSFPPPGAIRVTAGADASGSLVVPTDPLLGLRRAPVHRR